MRDILSRPHLQALAVSSGFCKRTSKLRPEIFLDMLLYTVSQKEQESLSYMVSLLQSDFGVTMNKQSLNERFNEKSEAYVKAVLSEVLSEEFAKQYSYKLLPDFSRILIKDSTKFIVPPALESEYESWGGVNFRSKAGISIQYEYDLKSGKISDLAIYTGDRNDRADAGETTDNIKKGDLIIRDLGYFSTPVFKICMEKEAFFLSRLESTTNVYDEFGNQISFKDIYNSAQKSGIIEKEMLVQIGKQTRVPSRLILQLVSDQVYEKRIREKIAKSKRQGRRGQLTEETKIRSRFNLFITNAEESQLSAKQVFPLYRLRWQIELQFKCWKSIFKIDFFYKIKKHRYFTLLYVKLLLIIINLQITYSLQHSFIQPKSDKIKILSLNKSLKTLKTLFNEILSMFRGTCRKAKNMAQYIQNRLLDNHWLESKNKKLCLPEILHLIACKSNN
jgi:hypothetical protein